MSQRRLSTGKIATFLLTIVAVAAIGGFMAKDFLARFTDDATCRPEQATFKRYQAADGRPAAPRQPILDAEGKERHLAEWRGKGVVVNFWATWCAPCVKEMPQLDRLKAMLATEGVDVLAISEDRQGIAVAKTFHEVNKLRDLAVMADPKGGLLRAFKGQGLPTTVLIDRQGRHVGTVTGAAEWDAPEVVAFLKGCLGR